MIQLSRWKVILLSLALVFGVLLAFPNVLSAGPARGAAGLAAQERAEPGLDLQGGSYLLLEVDVAAMRAKRVDNLIEDVRVAMREAGIATNQIIREPGGRWSSSWPIRADTDAAYHRAGGSWSDRRSPAASAERQAQRSASDRVRLAFTQATLNSMGATAVDQSIEVVRRRIDSLGTREPSITRQGAERIVVQAPGESDPAALERVIGQTAQLTFQMVDVENSVQDAARRPRAAGRPVADRLGRRDPLSGQEARAGLGRKPDPRRRRRRPERAAPPSTSASTARARAASARRPPPISASPSPSSWTARSSRPRRSTAPITGGTGQITGQFSIAEASELVNLLNGGALPAPLTVEERRTVTAELGADAVKAGALSTLIGFVIIVLFMLLAYGFLFGGISVVGLILNGILIVAAMSLTQATLTLPGIAGLILTFAVAVDANVLIYERMRDEARAGRSVIASMDAGFNKAMGTIIDANLTTLVAAAIMFIFGAGPVRGFAWTLTIGVFTSVFSAVLVAQVLLAYWLKYAKPKTLPIAEYRQMTWWPLIKVLPQKTNFHFVKYARFAAVLSVVLCVASIVACFYPGLNMGIDFRGGASMEVVQAGRSDHRPRGRARARSVS